VKIKNVWNAVCYRFSKGKKNRWVFTSFNGHYSDNPKYISEKLHELDPSAEIIWLVEPKYTDLLPDYVKAVNIQSDEARSYVNTAEILVDNGYAQRGYNYRNGFFAKCKAAVNRFLYFKKS